MGYLRSSFSASMEKLAFSGAFAGKARAYKQEMQQANNNQASGWNQPQQSSNNQPQQQGSGWTRRWTEEQRKWLLDALDKRNNQPQQQANNNQPQQQASGWTRGLTDEKRKQLRDAWDKRREPLLRNRPDLRWRPGMTPEEEKKLQDRWNFYYKWQAK